MFKRYEHRWHVLLQFIPLRIYKFCLFQFSPRLFGYPNVHSTLRSMNREGFSRRCSTVGPGFITMFKAMPIDKGTHQGKLCSKYLDEAFCVLKVTGVLIEKTLVCISFRKYNSLKYNHVRIQKVMLMRGGRIKIPLYAGHHQPASETPFKLRFHGGPIMAQH